MENIGEKIRRIRKSKGISQMTVADTCNIKQSSYANIESGKTQNITI
jgi:transcriptional regulator with XRE-family HTH domain